MNDQDCVRFLQETLPQLHLNWHGFRRVRRQACKRLQRRLQQLQLPDLTSYRQYLDRHQQEWDTLDGCYRITISRFYRDRGIYSLLEREALPQLAAQAQDRGMPRIRVWSAGCGAGEEPYSLAILWALSPNSVLGHTGLEILATDIDPDLLQRARLACYPYSSIRELPSDWRETAFSRDGNRFCLQPSYRHAVSFMQHDLRSAAPGGPFDLVLCRNLAFTYFDATLQWETGQRIASTLRPGGLLVLGAHERLPNDQEDFEPWQAGAPLYRRQQRPGYPG
jgi:chemotaxis protein methyltransferase CheR